MLFLGQSKLVKPLKLWLPVLAWAALIFILSGTPYLKTDLKEDFILRKIAHASEYFIFTFLLFRAFRGSFKISETGAYACVFIVAFLYALSDEYHQTFIPGRNGASADVLIDLIGIFGFYIILRFRKK